MKKQFYLILPDIRSCHNVGAMFRTADACGVTKLFLVGYTPDPPRPQIDKVSLGAETWMPWEHRRSLKPLVSFLKKKGVFIIGLEKNDKSVDIQKLNRKLVKDKNLALIVGNEVEGINSEILAICDIVVHIPMRGKKESLNVSIAAGIAMYVLSKNI